MKDSIIYIIMIVGIFWWIHWRLNKITYYDYGDKEKATKKICILTGVHGDEIAGPRTIRKMIDEGYFHKIERMRPELFIRVIPCVNRYGYIHHKRYQKNEKNRDINRNFGEDGPIDEISSELFELVKEMDLVIDFHEGYDFHKMNPESIGSTISTSNQTKAIADILLNAVNKSIDEEGKKFTLRIHNCYKYTTLGCYLQRLNKDYILIETTGKREKQDLQIRMEQIRIIINTILFNI